MTGCSFFSSKPDPIQIDAAPVERAPLILPEVDALNMRTIKWIVITEDNIEEVFAELKENNTSLALFALTDNGYESMSLNLADIIKLIKQQQAVIAAYKDYYEDK